MILEFVALQLDKSVDDLLPINVKISVFHSAAATFHAPSDPSGTHGMRRERIRSTPSWRGPKPRRDCAFVVEDEMKPGMSGMNVVRVILFFSFEYEGIYYPCALVEWFERVHLDPVTGLWVVRPDIIHRRQNRRSVLHLDSFLRGAHLIPVYGTEMLPVGFDYSDSLDAFSAFYVNKYIDHHANEIAF
jgi:hypothetical protein